VTSTAIRRGAIAVCLSFSLAACGGTRDGGGVEPGTEPEQGADEEQDAEADPTEGGDAGDPDTQEDGATGAAARGSEPRWAGEAPACDRIEAFAARMTDIGIAYDYEPSTSPADLAAQVDVVATGTLTGGVGGLAAGASPVGDAYVAYEVAVDEVLRGDPASVGDTLWAAIAYAPGAGDVEDFRAAVAAGTPVAVFGWEATPELAELADVVPSVEEGFVTACEDGPLLGWAGSSGSWADLVTLDDVTADVRAGGS
jgi:hypothetical protein